MTYTATDGVHSVQTTRDVHVEDRITPKIHVVGDLTKEHAFSTTYVDPGATATDHGVDSVLISTVSTVESNVVVDSVVNSRLNSGYKKLVVGSEMYRWYLHDLDAWNDIPSLTGIKIPCKENYVLIFARKCVGVVGGVCQEPVPTVYENVLL